jgi:CheY-like chemotaxis protein
MSKILLIEPNTVLAKTYQAVLTKSGHELAHVTSAQAAINAADASTPDVIILELQLPRHSGIEFLHEFRSYPEWQTVPVIIHTAILPATMAGLGAALQDELGVRTILYKPKTSLKDLVQAVQEQLAA